jgi:hypothetical protein
LRTVSDLSFEWATKISSLSPVFRMTWLRRLEIRDFPRLTDLEGIDALQDLAELDLSGGMWKPLRVASVRPIAALRSLTSLTLQNFRVADDDVTVLANLTSLRSLLLSNQFDRSQVAFLAKRLNPRLDVPLAAAVESSLACDRCGGRRWILTGRRMPVLCRRCDAVRFERFSREFQDLVDSA